LSYSHRRPHYSNFDDSNCSFARVRNAAARNPESLRRSGSSLAGSPCAKLSILMWRMTFTPIFSSLTLARLARMLCRAAPDPSRPLP